MKKFLLTCLIFFCASAVAYSQTLTYKPKTYIMLPNLQPRTSYNESLNKINIYLNYADKVTVDNINLFKSLFNINSKINNNADNYNDLHNEYTKKLLKKRTEISSQVDTRIMSSNTAYNEYSLLLIDTLINYFNHENIYSTQISKFSKEDIDKLIILAYNAKIAQNLYFQSFIAASSFKNELINDYYANQSTQTMSSVLKSLEDLQDLNNLLYKELSKQLKKNKIKFKKPSIISTCPKTINTIKDKNKINNLATIQEKLITAGYTSSYINNELKKIERIKNGKGIYVGEDTSIKFFGNIPHNVYFINALNYFDKCPTVTTIHFIFEGLDEDALQKDLEKSLRQYVNKNNSKMQNQVNLMVWAGNRAMGEGIISARNHSKNIQSANLKHKTSNTSIANILSNLYANQYKYMKYSVKTIKFPDNTSQKLYFSKIITKINYVVIDNIPFEVTLTLYPTETYYYFNKSNSVKTSQNIIFSYYIKSMQLKSLNIPSAISNVQANKDILFNAYRSKYKDAIENDSINSLSISGKYISINLYSNNNNIQIEYKNKYDFSEYNTKFLELVKNQNLKKYKNNNMVDKI